jgi:hypothetical protein
MNTQTEFHILNGGPCSLFVPHIPQKIITRAIELVSSGVPQGHLAHCGLVGFRGRPKQWLLSGHSCARGCGRLSPFAVSMAAQRTTRVSDCGVHALCTVDDAQPCPWQTSVQVTLGMAHCMLSRHWPMWSWHLLSFSHTSVLPNKLSRALSV